MEMICTLRTNNMRTYLVEFRAGVTVQLVFERIFMYPQIMVDPVYGYGAMVIDPEFRVVFTGKNRAKSSPNSSIFFYFFINFIFIIALGIALCCRLWESISFIIINFITIITITVIIVQLNAVTVSITLA